jgi:hypothetical protein
VTWPDGTPVFLRGHERRYEALGSDLTPRGVLTTQSDLTDIVGLPSPHGSTRWVAIATGRSGGRKTEFVVGLDAAGATTWRWEPVESRVHSIAITHDAHGASGVIVGAGGAQGIVALDLDGKPRWDASKHYVAYEVRTHRAVPDRALVLSGGVLLFDETGSVLLGDRFGAREAFGPDRGWLDHGLVLPAADPEDRMSMILAGLRHLPEEPLLVRTDSHGGESWRATPTTEVEAIELVEPPDRPRLVVAVTAGGELLVVDESGTLRGRVELPGERTGGRLYLYGLAAGRLGTDGWFVAVRLLDGTLLYRMHPERIPPR